MTQWITKIRERHLHINGSEAMVEWWQAKSGELEKNFVPFPICPLQIPDGLAWD